MIHIHGIKQTVDRLKAKEMSMKRSIFLRIAILAMVVLLLASALVSCDSKNKIKGVYSSATDESIYSTKDIKLSFSGKKVEVSSFVLDSNRMPYMATVSGTYEIDGKYIKFEFDKADRGELPTMFASSRKHSFKRSGDDIVVGGVTFQQISSKASSSSSRNPFSSISTSFLLMLFPIILAVIVGIFGAKQTKKRLSTGMTGKQSTVSGSVESNRMKFAEALKKGKSEDQQKCIDFFFAVEDPSGKKSKGCLARNTDMSIDDYCGHVQKIVDGLGLKERAIAKIGLDESQISEIPPIVLNSFVYTGDDILHKSEEIEGDDLYNGAKPYRHVTSKYSVTWIFFSAKQLFAYTYEFDTTSDNVLESTKDFFYSDIKSIRTAHEIEELIIETTESGCFKKKQKFVHRNKHWDALHITVPGESYSFVCRTTDTLEQSIQAAKAMIREKKEA